MLKCDHSNSSSEIRNDSKLSFPFSLFPEKRNSNDSDLFSDSHNTNEWRGPGWYRFTVRYPYTGTRIPESKPQDPNCGWLSGKHPTSTAESVDVRFCFQRYYESCSSSTEGKITNCGDFFVYYLEDAPYCPHRYCATN